MRGVSPLLTIAAAANTSNGIEIGNQKIVGIIMVTKGDFTDAEMIAVQQLVSGNLGQGNEVWGTTNIVTLAGVATALGITGAEWEAATVGATFHFQDEPTGVFTTPAVRLALVVAATGALGTNAAAQIQARLILEPHR